MMKKRATFLCIFVKYNFLSLERSWGGPLPDNRTLEGSKGVPLPDTLQNAEIVISFN